ncbi:site-specific DNA-methyltransferase, partial [Chryseobacterium sp. HMWF028]
AKYYVVEDNDLAIITSKFTDSIQKDIISSKPKRVIALDSVFNNDDCKKTNAILKFEQDGIYFNSI